MCALCRTESYFYEARRFCFNEWKEQIEMGFSIDRYIAFIIFIFPIATVDGGTL